MRPPYARPGSPVDFVQRHWRALLAALATLVPAVWLGVTAAHDKLQQLERIPALEARMARNEAASAELLLQSRLTQQQLDMIQAQSTRDTSAILGKLDRVLDEKRDAR